ncbi:MAG: amino acid adenylation domain-containing protein, partial [Cyanobacteria bacterium J06626_26]
ELPETNFITDYIRPSQYCSRNRSVQLALDKAVSQAVLTVCNGSHASVYVFLLSVVNILLAKYTSHSDLIVGIPVLESDAYSETAANVILPLRTRINQDLTFKDVLLQVKERTIGAYVNQNYPVEWITQLLELPSYQNRCSLFDVVVVLETIHSYDKAIAMNNDVTFLFNLDGDCIKGKLEYSDGLFVDGAMDEIAKCYTTLVTCVINQLDIKLGDITFLDNGARFQLLEGFNDNQGIYPLEQTISTLFEKQVEQTPDHIAVVWKDTQLTYQDLNTKANQLARLLQSLGLKPGEFVGILKDRDINFLIAILAIHKARGAYVPIDSTYPLDRISYMLSNSQVRFLLTDNLALEILNNLSVSIAGLRHVICLNSSSEQITNPQLSQVKLYRQDNFLQLPQENLDRPSKATDPAYMLYTSGSTGLPKGAIIRHDGAVNHIYGQVDALALHGGFNFLQSAPASSDISVWQFLGPLLTGGKTVIVDTETVCSPEKLFKVIKTEQLTLVELVPIVLRSLIEHSAQLLSEQRLLPDLLLMMVTGEYVPVELVNQWLQLYPDIKVANAYGPTEAADDITQAIIETPLPENQRTVPIGKPLANLKLYVLDDQMQLVPIGAPGEICVSGIGVGNGYWQNEEKTQASFLLNPFADPEHPLPNNNKDIIYRTGDLGRWLPDGNLEFLGRIDNQVKIRGFRIELGEIESLLSQHPLVKETVVIVREDNPGNKILVAYIVEPKKSEDSELQLREFLQERLPEHMVPSVFMPLASLPLTPSGKIDRRSLPAPTRDKTAYVPPSTPTQKSIAELWQQILGIERVGIHDNFFELGGHSLLITQLLTKLQNTFEVKVSLRKLFGSPTIAAIAQEIERIQQAPPGTILDEDAAAIDFAAEAVLEDRIQPNGVPYNPATVANAIFLTGATGFLGAFLLSELLQQTQADIYCLVRSADTKSGKQKIQSKLESYQLWEDAFSDRIVPLIGDLSQPLLGCSKQQFQHLAQQLDVIYHSGALVDSISPYQRFKAANVLGTQEILRLACQTKVKPVHFVSSTGVVPSGNAAAGSIKENGNLDDVAMPGSGYAQSKRVAEKLVTIACDRGLPICIYRPGFITGHSKTGICNTGDIIYRMIKGCIQIESMPNLDVSLDLNPCDYVSQAIVYLSQQQTSLGNVFHLVNPQPLSMADVYQYVRSVGFPMEFVEYEQWRSKLVKQGNSPDNALYPLIPILAEQDNITFEGDGVSSKGKQVDPHTVKPVVQPFDASDTLASLENSSIVCPALDEKLLANYFAYLVQSGFLSENIAMNRSDQDCANPEILAQTGISE